jgi:predicted CopG family antitoxin
MKTVTIHDETYDHLVKWQLSEQVRQGRKMTLSETVDALLAQVPMQGF